MTIDQPADADAGDSDKPSVPDDPEQLKQDIEQTREQLGETVEALVAKADVKAQAKEKVGQLTDRVKGSTAQAKEQATTKVAQARDQLTTKTQDVKQAATTTGAPAKEQFQARATAVGGKVRDVTPEPVQRAARHAAARTSPRQAGIAAVAVGVALLGIILIRRRRRS
jgi:cobalamin biosynthesis Mg chelatase CobN